MAIFVFNRYEKKYLMPQAIYQRLRERLVPYMQVDEYGLHTICNIYYDTADQLLIRRSIEKPPYKEKLRLRSYGIPTAESTVFVEIKKKYQDVVNKRRIALTLQQAYDYLDRGVRPPAEGPILRELDCLLERYPLHRGLFLAYDRVAMVGREDPEFRVTFDRRIRSRRTDLALERGDGGELLLPEGWALMETKVLGATPLWFTRILSELALYPVSFSKYGSIYCREQGGAEPLAALRHREENWNRLPRRRDVC
jgi:hypothetical protein